MEQQVIKDEAGIFIRLEFINMTQQEFIRALDTHGSNSKFTAVSTDPLATYVFIGFQSVHRAEFYEHLKKTCKASGFVLKEEESGNA